MGGMVPIPMGYTPPLPPPPPGRRPYELQILSACPYCDKMIHLDTRGRCKNRGAHETKIREKLPGFKICPAIEGTIIER